MTTGSRRSVLVDTNRILDICLGRGAESLHLFDAGRAGSATIYVPGFAVAESIKALETLGGRWRTRDHDLALEIAEAQRSQIFLEAVAPLESARRAVAVMRANLDANAWVRLADIVRHHKVLELNAAMVAALPAVLDVLGLDPGDAAILSTLVGITSSTGCRDLLSRDSDFERPAVTAYLRDRRLRHWRDASAYLATLN